MQRHAEIGHRLLSGSASEVLELAATIALVHHERWDGNGYPLRPRRRGDPARGAHRLCCRRLRRAHDRSRLPRGDARRGGARDDAGAAWLPVRPADLRCARGHRPRDAARCARRGRHGRRRGAGARGEARGGHAARCVDRVVGKAGESQDLRAATASRLPGRRARVRGRPRTQRDRGGSGEALSRRSTARCSQASMQSSTTACGSLPSTATRRSGTVSSSSTARWGGRSARGRSSSSRTRRRTSTPLLRRAASPQRSRSRSRPGTASPACSTWSRSG